MRKRLGIISKYTAVRQSIDCCYTEPRDKGDVFRTLAENNKIPNPFSRELQHDKMVEGNYRYFGSSEMAGFDIGYQNFFYNLVQQSPLVKCFIRPESDLSVMYVI